MTELEIEVSMARKRKRGSEARPGVTGVGVRMLEREEGGVVGNPWVWSVVRQDGRFHNWRPLHDLEGIVSEQTLTHTQTERKGEGSEE